MGVLNIRHWFQKRESALSAVEVAREQMGRFNALLRSDPKDLTNAITSFDAGNLAPLARLIEEYERRDDKMKTCSMKMKASVARCDYSVQLREGFEVDPRAERHAEVLRRFWSTVRATSSFNRNESGGFNLLKKQMMDAQSYGYAVHELVWRPTADGELRAEFVHVPLWHFENRTGELRFLPTTTHCDGVPMRPGEWMVTTGDGVGIAAALCACMKRMGLVDWMIYNERCGMPLLHGSTGAAFGSDQWNNLNKAIKNIARYTQIITDASTKIEPIPLGGGASIPYPQLVEWCDRAIAALYRGADLSTVSQGGAGVGASLQGDESDMLEQDACGRLSDVLNEAVDRFVIRYVTGDDEPLARIVVEPVAKPNVDTDIRIDQHLVSLGARLSRNDALQRYGRVEADPGDPQDAPLEMKQQPATTSPGFANEAPDSPDAPSTEHKAPSTEHKAPSTANAILADIAATILDGSTPFEDALKEAQRKLEAVDPSLLAGDLEDALEKAMFDAAAKATGRKQMQNERSALSNSGHPYTKCPACGKFMNPNGSCANCDFVEDDDRLIARGKRALQRATSGDPTDVPDAMYRKGVGAIDFVQGWNGKGKAMEHGAGLMKIQQKHGTEMAQIPVTIAKGRITPLTVKGSNAIDKDGVAIINGSNIAILSRAKGDHWRLVTHYKSDTDAKKITEAAKYAASV